MIGRPDCDNPERIWVTQPEALTHFTISRTTLWRWRQKHLIREMRVKRFPTMFNLADLQHADAEENRKNPVVNYG